MSVKFQLLKSLSHGCLMFYNTSLEQMILFINEFKNITENTVNEFSLWVTHLTNLKCSVCNKGEFHTTTNLESYKLHLGFVQKKQL